MKPDSFSSELIKLVKIYIPEEYRHIGSKRGSHYNLSDDIESILRKYKAWE